MKEKLNKGIMILPIIATVFLVLGATFAYFSASVTGNNTVNVVSYKFDITLTITRVNPATQPAKGYGMIPLSESNIATAINAGCVDSNGYTACTIYDLTFTNNSGAAVTLDGGLNVVTNNFANLKYSVTALGENKTNLHAGNAVGNSVITDGFTNLTIPIGVSTMYLMLYIENDPSNNQPNDQGRTFTGSVSFTDAAGGAELYGQFDTGNYAYTANLYSGDYGQAHNVLSHGLVTIGSTIPADVQVYQSPGAAIAALENIYSVFHNGEAGSLPFFFKHVLDDNDIVTESYIGFVISHDTADGPLEQYTNVCNSMYSGAEADACIEAYDGPRAGTYYLRGENTYQYIPSQGYDTECINPDPVTDECGPSEYYSTNVDTLLTAFGSSNCSYNGNQFECGSNYLSVAVYDNGRIYIDNANSSNKCEFYETGQSSCYIDDSQFTVC